MQATAQGAWLPGEVNPLAASIQSPTNQKPMRRRVEFEGRRPWQGAANGIDASQLTRFARCGCLNARDGSVRITQGADPVGAIPDKGSFAPFAQDSPSESGEISTDFGFCLSAFPLPAYAFPPLAYRELGPSVSEEGASPSQTNRGEQERWKE